jgi:hypothetical protein
MPKRQKDAPPTTNNGSETAEMINRARSTLDKAVGTLDRCVETVSDTLASGDYSKDLASHLAWLAKQLAGITGELRKLEAHEEKISKSMSPERRHLVVMAYLEALPSHRLRECIEAMQRIYGLRITRTGGTLAQ